LKIAKKNSHPLVFCVPAELGIGYRHWGQKNSNDGATTEKEVWRYIKPSGYNPPAWRTERQMDGRTDWHRATAKTALTHSVAR